MNPATFQLNAARLEAWAHSLSSNAPIIDVLREAIEFKKLNNNYFKSSIFEDVIGDIYAHLYETVVPELIAKETAEENRVRMRVDNILTTSSTNATETPPPGPAGEQVGERRTKANRVTSREIIRKAEAIAAKPVLTVPAKILKPLAPAPASEQGKVPGTPALAVVVHDDATRDPGSSVPGSVHDSADDESELSEADEEVLEVKATSAGETRAPLFPNLVSTNTGATKTDGMDTSGGGFVTANEGLDEEEEEEMEEEEEDLQEEDMQAKRGAKEAEIQGEAMEL